jgi:cell division protein FtsB
MIVLREMRRRARTLAGPVFGLALIGYFAYHLVEGDRGLLAWRHTALDLAVAKQDLAAVSAERDALEQRVSHLRSDHVDPDLLDTEVRKTLDVGSPDEIVIMRAPGKH